MSRLYLLRHGIAVPSGTPGVPDEERPLTKKGESRVELIGKALRRLEIEPDRILTSPLPRARRTAEIVATVLDLEDRLEDADALRPGSSAASIREWLRSRSEPDLMLVGHNPDLNELLGRLLGMSGDELPFELKKGGVVALRTDSRDRYQLHWLATPRLFRKLVD